MVPDRRASDEIPNNVPWPTLAAAGILFAIAGLFGYTSGLSPDNCGELPGIARTATAFLIFVVAAGVFVVGFLAAAVSRRALWLGRGAILAFALIVGVQLGGGLAGEPRCDGGGGGGGGNGPIVPTPRVTAGS